MKHNLIISGVLILIIFLIKMTGNLPWWFFTVPVFFTGVTLRLKNVSFDLFLTSFFSGFVVWFGANIFFDSISSSRILDVFGGVLSLPKIVVILISGLIGGILTSLSLYAGTTMIKSEEPPNFH